MRLSIQTPQQNTEYAHLRDVWQAADELGFHAAFTYDHLVPLAPGARPGAPGDVPSGSQLEGWVTLAALAEATRNLRVGTLVTGVTYRSPALLAKMAVTLDHVSAGRAILGVGAAWHDTEHRMFGLPFPTVGERMTLLDETLSVFRLLCQSDEAVDFEGSMVTVRRAPFEPKPVPADRRLPVLVGGSGARLLGIAARHADLYNGFWAPWEWRRVNTRLDAMLGSAGRRGNDLERTAFVFAELSPLDTHVDALVAEIRRTRGGSDDQVRARVVAGNAEAIGSVLRSYADAGVEQVILNLRPPIDIDALARFAERVLLAVDG